MTKDGPECLPGKGCSPVIEMKQEFGEFISGATQKMHDHAKESEAVWKGHEERVEKVLAKVETCFEHMSEAALRMNDGKHRMSSIESDVDNLGQKQREDKKAIDESLKLKADAEDLETHESGEFGAHTNIASRFRWLSGQVKAALTCCICLGIYVFFAHRELIDMAARWWGITK